MSIFLRVLMKPLYALTTHHCTPAEAASHGGMFTLVEVVPKDPEAKWNHRPKGIGLLTKELF